MDKLFDFTFDYLITRTILKVLYAIFVALLTIGVFAGVIFYAREGSLPGIIGVVIAYLIVLLLIRVLFEDRLVKFQMAEDIKKIRENLISTD